MNQLNMAVIGATGRMGQEIAKVLQQDPVIKMKIGVTRSQKAPGFDHAASLSQMNQHEPDVIIDFSLPENCDEVLVLAKSQKRPLVSGVTGLSEGQFKKMREVAREIPVFWSPNMSPGIAFLMKTLEDLSHLPGAQFIVSDIHHSAKKDNPSGTAQWLASALQKGSNKVQLQGGVRAGQVVGIHDVKIILNHEVIEIRHWAQNRAVFAQGAVEAAKWIVNQKPGFYSMRDWVNDTLKLNS